MPQQHYCLNNATASTDPLPLRTCCYIAFFNKIGNLRLEVDQEAIDSKYSVKQKIANLQPSEYLVKAMLLKDKETGALLKVLSTDDLINPAKSTIKAKSQEGQEEQDSEEFAKSALVFPSDESLPQCWLDANYQASLK